LFAEESVRLTVSLFGVHHAFLHHLGVELSHELSKDDWIHIVRQHVQKAPISHLKFLCDVVQNINCAFPVPQFPFDQVAQEGRVEDNGEPEDEEEAGDEGEEEEPEPEEDIDLLIDHIDWQHAQGIVGLYCPRETKLLEDALGHPREDTGHWVNPVLRVNLTHKSCHL